MSGTTPDPQAVVRELISLCGGLDQARERFERDYTYVTGAWEQDTGAIGRILRAHLFVEHFLIEYLVARNPELGDVEEARLSFVQKLTLVGKETTGIAYLLPGVRRLNSIRNRLAHTLHAEVSKHDAEAFLSIGLFRAMRDALSAPNIPSTDPLDVLEGFAKHAGLTLHASASGDADLWAEAFRRVRETELNSEDQTSRA